MPEIRVTLQQKKAVAERAQGCCEYCRSQARFAVQPFSVEHIIPRSQETLQLNREGVANLRRILYAMGEHPPTESNEQG